MRDPQELSQQAISAAKLQKAALDSIQQEISMRSERFIATQLRRT
jgi:hypothetical protein